MKTSTFTLLAAAVCGGLLLCAGNARADDLEQVDGHLWKTLPKIAKQAWLVGVNNLIDVEYAYQTKIAKSKPRNDQTLIQRMYTSGDGHTIDDVIRHADHWYRENPDELDKAVLDVLWRIFVLRED